MNSFISLIMFKKVLKSKVLKKSAMAYVIFDQYGMASIRVLTPLIINKGA